MLFAKAVRSECVRLRRSPLTAMHAVLAVALGLGAGAYFAASPWDSLLGTDAFCQVMGAAAPLLAGLSCGLSVDAERQAGNLANLLGAVSRRRALLAKGTVLLALGLVAALVATGLFFGVLTASARPTPSLGTCMLAALGVAAGSACSYAVLLWVALRFGRNASIGVGALGSIVAMASMGGLANGLVTGTLSGAFGTEAAVWLPFAWPSRLASLIVEMDIAPALAIAASAVGEGASVAADAAAAAVSSASATASASGPIVGSQATAEATAAGLQAAFFLMARACVVGTAAVLAVAALRANRFEDRRRDEA